MLATLEAMLKKAAITQLMLLGSLLLLTGCATVGANLALDLAKEEEAKGCDASYPGDNVSKVKLEDCERISRLIKKAGVPGGFVGYDNKSGKIKLKGSYLNEEQVDLAHMVALTVVGANSAEISEVTPRDLQEIKMVKSYAPQQNSGGKGNKYALLVGISEFKKINGRGIKGIATAVKDVNALKEVLYRNGFKKENITLLTDKQAKKANILNAARELEGKVTPNDSVVVYISTHGTPPNTFGKMGIIPYDLKSEFDENFYKEFYKEFGEDLEKEDVQALANSISKDESGDPKIIQIAKQRIAALKTAISFNDLQDFITSIKTDKLVAILDTCYSGAALGALTYPVGGDVQNAVREQNYSQSQSPENKSELLGSGKMCEISGYNNTAVSSIRTQQQTGTAQEKCKKSSGSKGLALDTDTAAPSETTWLARGNYEYEMMEKFRAAFGGANTQRQQGKAILTATSGHEKSQFDTGKLPTSYFTYYLVKGLEDSHGQIFPAFDYAQIRTRKIVSENLENCSQTPEMVSTPNACINIDLSK